ncbi:hypothetical protein B0H13DRAFT_1874439 [Mycena leptocephala]|nr:hypothetical protein B0H13DRAFT_1874439 [Mycena leptocephala]
MCSAAADDTLGHSPRDNEIYGEPWGGEASEVGNEEDDDNLPNVPTPRLKKKAKRTRNTAGAQPARNFSKGDQALSTLCNFMRVTFWYMDLCAATAEGDIGRVFEIIKIKRLFNSKSHDFDSKHLSEAVGLNIAGISKLRETFPGLFGLKQNGQQHKDAATVHDINRLGIHCRNTMSSRHSKLLDGQLEIFLTRTAGGGSVIEDDNSTAPLSEGPLPDFPANPVCL